MAATSGGGTGSGKPSLPERVAQLYYALGLFCSTYPTTIITLAVAVVLLCCYPLVNLPLPGNLPQQVSSGENNNITSSGHQETWCYVQQIVLRSAVVPWTPGLALADAFRAPLYEVFKLLDVVRNYQKGPVALPHLCLHVESVKRGLQHDMPVLPEYSCLVLSPANFWQQDVQQFNLDPHLLTTIFNHQNIQKGKTSVAELLFGINLKEAGIKRYPLRNRQRVLQYAITIVFKQYDPHFITGLQRKLETLYPLHQPNRTSSSNINHNNNEITTPSSADAPGDIVYIYFPGVFNYVELVPLTISFVILFFYVYFSVRKVDIINSKVAMAFAAVVTVLGSLFMSIGLCFFFGLTMSMQGKEIFPYLVILVGLENVLVLTKSVVSTPQHLDVKIRIAQGLSKEGWSITKNILVEITILTIGLATFVPGIQEFSIFAIVGLISDFFLQMFFFSTILGIDIHRTEITAEKSHNSFRNSLYQTHTMYDSARLLHTTSPPRGMSRSKSHPRLTGAHSSHTNVVAAPQGSAAHEKRIPKRLRLVNIWARTRFFQRAFMILMMAWISIIVYSSGVLEQVFESAAKEKHNVYYRSRLASNHTPLHSPLLLDLPTLPLTTAPTDSLGVLRPSAGPQWPRLPAQHWPALFSRYNVSLAGKRIALLPSIRLAHAVSPEQAEMLRNPLERDGGEGFRWPALAAALDPIDFYELNTGKEPSPPSDFTQPYYPHSPMEILLAGILCGISVVVVAYFMVVLYRCVCTRNYAEWRASWSGDRGEDLAGGAAHLVMDAVPMVLDGHTQEVECLVTDGASVVSSCLGGVMKVWDAATGEMLSSIDRKIYFGLTSKSPDPDPDDSMLSDYESGSPPSRDEHCMSFPSLQASINTNFTNLKLVQEPLSAANTRLHSRSFDFGDQYRQLYLNHGERGAGVRHRGGSETARKTSSTHSRKRSSLVPQIIAHTGRMSSRTKWIVNQASQNLLGASVSTTSKKTVSEDRKHSGVGTTGSTEDCTAHAHVHVPPIWCMDYMDNLIVLGCSNGRLEFWEGTTGKLKCIFEDGSGLGVTSLKLVGSRVIVAKLNGSLDFLQLQSYSQGRQIDWGFTSAYRRTHVRTGSTGSILDTAPYSHDVGEDLRCIRVHCTKAHGQPVTALDSEGGRVLSGSQDHTLRVFRLEDATALYTLHGHCGPITCLFIDRVQPMTAGSGSQDGLLCVWDLATGACVYSTQAHDGSITSLTYSASYVISLGTDDRLCVWERFQGHLLNTIPVAHSYTAPVLMLTHHLLVTARQGSLAVLDVRTGDTVRLVSLGHKDACVFVKQQLLLRDASVVCDYGTQLRIVRFPLITHKFE